MGLVVVGIRVEGLVGHDMVFQKGLQVFLAVSAEQERIDPGAKLAECKVRGRKEGAADVIRSVVENRDETGLTQTKFKRAEFTR